MLKGIVLIITTENIESCQIRGDKILEPGAPEMEGMILLDADLGNALSWLVGSC